MLPNIYPREQDTTWLNPKQSYPPTHLLNQIDLLAQILGFGPDLSKDQEADRRQIRQQALTKFLNHGGLYMLADPTVREKAFLHRLTPTIGAHAIELDLSVFISELGRYIQTFFTKLVEYPYHLSPELIAYLSDGKIGITHTPLGQDVESKEIPAAFTFVGQFIDHDVTMNGLNLILQQDGPDVPNLASPLIDLDNVYGTWAGRPPAPASQDPKPAPSSQIFSRDKFNLVQDSDGVCDLPRNENGFPVIADLRNDENQLILQVHLLIMRTHNKLVNDFKLNLNDAYIETLFNWQSVVLNDYLPRIIEPSTLARLQRAMNSGDYSSFRYGPFSLGLPHEFAIGFRFGHSQLRSEYQMNRNGPKVPLFDNSQPATGAFFTDLRGGQKLTKPRLIDWDFFANSIKSNRIDSKITDVVFDLPKSTVPDMIKAVRNLPERNLVRSSNIGLCSGEDLQAFYGLPPIPPNEIEPDPDAQTLFSERNGTFATPLFFYFLKEAELFQKISGGATLGKLGSCLVGEVLVSSIVSNPPERNIVQNASWKSRITGKREVKLLDLGNWVSSSSCQ